MLEQLYSILKVQFNAYGMETIGYLIMGVCFGLFYFKSMQKYRFRWISRACYVWALGNFLRIVVPSLVVLNPAFALKPAVASWMQMVFVCLGLTCLWMSLLMRNYGKKQLWTIFGVCFVLQLVELYFLCGYFQLSAEIYMLALAWFVVGISLIRVESTGKTALFGRLGEVLMLLAAYYICREHGLFTSVKMMPLYIFGGSGLFVLIVQTRYMRSYCAILIDQLEEEKKRRTLFWDIAPFPILVSKLLDDSVIYINPTARRVLNITPQEVGQFHLSDYFADSAKRTELVDKVRQDKIIDNFEVQMRSPNNDEKLWLTLSARVIELDGELALYLNLHNITDQKNTEEQLFIQASTDTLTGLNNRRQFETLFKQAIANAVRYQTPYCLLMSDIDHFKMVNDTYGHEAGDIVLKSVADLMKKSFRSSDILGRFGGEEFIVFLSNTDETGGKIAAEHFREAVAQALISAEGKQIPITISIGLTCTSSTGLLDLTKEADLALYYSKEHGRNQVSVYTPEMGQADKEKA